MKTINSLCSKLFALTLALMASVSTFAYKSQWCDTWNVMWFDGLFFDETASTSQYRLGKDTVIGNYTYSKFTSRTSVRFTSDRKVYVYYEGFDDNDPYSEDLPIGEYLAYDFSAKVGDTLEVFSGVTYNTKTYKCVVYDVQTDLETNLLTIKLHPLVVVDGNGNVEVSSEEITWIEGVGSPRGFLIGTTLPGGGLYTLLCAYQDDELKYTGSFYERFGCEYNAGVVSDDLFPTLSGLQRTICREYYEQADNKTRIEQFTNLTTRTETGGPYLYCSPFLLREEDNKILIYSRSLDKDLVLYDFNLQVGDSLPMLYIDFFAKDDWIADSDMEIWCIVDYHKDLEGNILPADTLIVTDVSAITLLDGKEYKKWTFNNGMEYVEGIGSFGNRQWSGDFFQLIANRDVPTSLLGEHLVCASKNNKLLYQMDDAEMERLGAECLCEVENPEDLFPTLWGLQRTGCTKTIGENGNGTTVWGSRSYLMQEIETATIGGKQYLLFGTNNIYDEYCSLWLREENNKILLYSTAQKKDLVLYDFTLNVGDSLPRLYVDYDLSSVVDYDNDEWGLSPLVVTEVSTITLLDGKEYKKWTFDNGMQYVEGIGSFGTCYGHNDFYQLIVNAPLYSDVYSQHLVCTSRNGQLLYQMDDEEMERLGAECLCEVETSYKSQWCDTWNVMFSNGSVYPPSNTPYRYQLAKDTVIGEHTYTAVVSKAINDALDAPRYVAAVRFTDDRKVYIYYDNAEYLLYDFNVQQGDELEVFAGINNYRFGIKTYKCIVTGVEQYACIGCPATITLHVPNHPDDFTEIYRRTQWQEGVGDVYSGFLNGVNGYVPVDGGGSVHLLCAYQGDELKYTGDLYEEYGCGDNAEQSPADLFPTLWGLQQTICSGYYGEEGDEWASGLTGPSQEITMMDGKPYLQWGSWYLREENDKILVYSEIQKKDLVLYDFTLELGDTLTTLNLVTPEFLEYEGIVGIVDYPLSDYDYTYPIDTLVVTELSKETLLDGKEYTRWKFSDGTVYVEGIGSMSETFFHHIADHLPVPVSYLGSYLVCVSKNNKLLYQMDDAEMERLGAECLCDYNRGPRKDNAKDGQIGGRPTPTQWNQLEVVLRQMNNNHTILQAETFSYTLEDISQQVNNKTYFQLARQSTKDTATTKSVVGALHFGKDEDNRVYFLRDGVEYVLYDFTAEPGDTIEIFAGINNYPQETTYTHVVVDKDTTEDGACRMFLKVVFPDETTTATNAEKVWLAGLGSIDGIVHNTATRTSNAYATPSRSASSETQTSVMLCAWREDSCLYTTNHPDYNDIGCIYNQDPTALESPTSPSSYKKILREGQLLIMHDGKIYTIMGIEIK